MEITGLIGLYTDPRHVIAYSDGEVRQQFNACFAATVVGGQLEGSDESTALEFIPPPKFADLPMHVTQRLRLSHYTEQRSAPFLG